MALKRLANGRFAVGNSGGPGNPHARRTAHIKRVLLDAVSDDDLRGILRALIAQAKEGNAKAAEIVLGRLLGKVTAEPLDADLGMEVTERERPFPLGRDNVAEAERLLDAGEIKWTDLQVTEDNLDAAKDVIKRYLSRATGMREVIAS